ncbi:hypothetical protein V8E54_006804 [Elaphomyces granulatus]
MSSSTTAPPTSPSRRRQAQTIKGRWKSLRDQVPCDLVENFYHLRSSCLSSHQIVNKLLHLHNIIVELSQTYDWQKARVCRVLRTTPSTSAHPRKAPPTNLESSAGPVRQIAARGTTNAEEITRRRTANNETPSHKTIQFTRVMRQAWQLQAPEMVQFRNVLEEHRLRITNWGFLSCHLFTAFNGVTGRNADSAPSLYMWIASVQGMGTFYILRRRKHYSEHTTAPTRERGSEGQWLQELQMLLGPQPSLGSPLITVSLNTTFQRLG